MAQAMKTLTQLLMQDTVSNGDIRYMQEEVKDELCTSTPNCNGSLRERMYWMQNGLTEYPKCKQCSGNLRTTHFKTNIRGGAYTEFCSRKCAANNSTVNQRKQDTSILKYGTSHPFKSSVVQNKRIKTNLAKYGTSHPHPWDSDTFKTFIENKYGVSAVRDSSEIHQKIIETIFTVTKESLPIKIAEIESAGQYTCVSNISNVVWNSRRISDILLTWKHTCGALFTSRLYYKDGLQVRACPTCSKGTSKLEQEILSFIGRNTNLEVLHRVKLFPPHEVDIYIPSLNLAFEVDGTYWHSSKFTPKNKTRYKFDECKKIGVKLITIPESQYTQHRGIVEAKILNLLGCSTRIYARQCAIAPLDAELRNFFFQQHHIDGDRPATETWALVKNGVTVMAISFGRPGFNTNYDWEIIRMCSNSNATVIGGASRLIRHFKKMHPRDSIITYANLNWGEGKTYTRAGMRFTGYTNPGYIYVRGDLILTRYQAQKNKLIKLLGVENYNPFLTGQENMQLAGYLTIYDRGNAVYVLDRQDDPTAT